MACTTVTQKINQKLKMSSSWCETLGLKKGGVIFSYVFLVRAKRTELRRVRFKWCSYVGFFGLIYGNCLTINALF